KPGTPGAITQVEPGFQLSLRAPGEGCRPGRRVALDGREPGERLDRQGPGLAVVAEEDIAEGGTREAAGRETVDAIAADDAHAQAILLDRAERCGGGTGVDRPITTVALAAGPDLEARGRGHSFCQGAVGVGRTCAEGNAQRRRHRPSPHSPEIANATHTSQQNVRILAALYFVDGELDRTILVTVKRFSGFAFVPDEKMELRSEQTGQPTRRNLSREGSASFDLQKVAGFFANCRGHPRLANAKGGLE